MQLITVISTYCICYQTVMKLSIKLETFHDSTHHLPDMMLFFFNIKYDVVEHYIHIGMANITIKKNRAMLTVLINAPPHSQEGIILC